MEKNEKTAMILAAGRGERLRPLTDSTPKPLVVAGGKPLILWQMERLALAGFRHLVINIAYLGAQIVDFVKKSPDVLRLNFKSILFSVEKEALETAGGIKTALPLIQKTAGDLPFLITNADIYAEFDYLKFYETYKNLKNNQAAILLVNNPQHNKNGDFSLCNNKICLVLKDNTLTYSGTGIFTADFFKDIKENEIYKLKPLLDSAILENRLFGEKTTHYWLDVGNIVRLNELKKYLIKKGLC